MSYGYTIDEDTTISINSDLSMIWIYRKGHEGPLVKIDKELFLQVAADYVRMNKIAQLENQSPKEILGCS